MPKSLRFLKPFLQLALTLGLLAVAVIAGHRLWLRYMDGPWTRDGRVRADVVTVAADVPGLVTEVAVADNQFVHQGDLLFRIDPARFKEDLAQARAELATRKAELAVKHAQARRRASLDDQVISRENREDAQLEEDAARARVEAAQARVDLAALNLARTEIKAPAEGWVSNLLVHRGEYVQAGQARLAVVDRRSFWVYGYFEENRLQHVHVGDPARLTLLGGDQTITGHVESIARGITDRDNATGGTLLADVNPSFSWVRLAQRIPVRIQIDAVPDGIELVAGMSCSVRIDPRPSVASAPPAAPAPVAPTPDSPTSSAISGAHRS